MVMGSRKELADVIYLAQRGVEPEQASTRSCKTCDSWLSNLLAIQRCFNTLVYNLRLGCFFLDRQAVARLKLRMPSQARLEYPFSR